MSIIEPILGLRIKHYRKKIGYTQKELAEIIGLNESTIRNYELCNRTPDRITVRAIADALEIDPYTLDCADILHTSSIAHILFDLENQYSLIPTEIDGEIVLKLAPEKSPAYELNNISALNSKEMGSILRDWHQAYNSCVEKKITPEDYDTWKDKYPNFTNFDEKGVPVYGKDVNPHYHPMTLKEHRKMESPIRSFVAKLDKKLIEFSNTEDGK